MGVSLPAAPDGGGGEPGAANEGRGGGESGTTAYGPAALCQRGSSQSSQVRHRGSGLRVLFWDDYSMCPLFRVTTFSNFTDQLCPLFRVPLPLTKGNFTVCVPMCPLFRAPLPLTKSNFTVPNVSFYSEFPLSPNKCRGT